MRSHAAVVGAGIGGVAIAVSLRQHGWRVSVYERAAILNALGAGIALAPNGLRALDAFGAGDVLRTSPGIQGEGGIRRPSGRWLSHSHTQAISARFGDPIIAVHRGELLEALARRLPVEVLHTGTTVTGVDSGGVNDPARLATDAGEVDADLVVAADGIGSTLRTDLFPDHPGPSYAGYTCWRMLVPAPSWPVNPSETWGRGARFGVVPLAADRIYCFATANAPQGRRHGDPRAELLRRFGRWHDPIPALLALTDPDAVHHHDIKELAVLPHTFHRGRVALVGDAAHAITPNLGQGGCLALEDAAVLGHLMRHSSQSQIPTALARYTRIRRPRALDIGRRSRRTGMVAQASSPFAAATRDLGMLLAGLLPSALTPYALDPVVGWRPPRSDLTKTSES